MKDKLIKVRDYILEHSKIIYPIILVFAVAFTVFIALKLGNKKVTEEKIEEMEVIASTQEGLVEVEEVQDTSLVLTDNQALQDLFAKYYVAYAEGDIDTIKGLFESMTDTDALVISEMSKYIADCPTVDVYTKPGPVQNSYLAYVYFTTRMDGYDDVIPGLQVFYVCGDENGQNLYLKNLEMISDNEVEYINSMGNQDDIKELQNRVEVEFSDVAKNNPELLKYVEEVAVEVKNSVGKLLAESYVGEDPEVTPDPDAQDPGQVVVDPGTEGTGENTYVPTVVTAKASTTVNLRSSDSEKSDKIGKVPSGANVEVVEQKVNGWSHVRYDGKEGYIKSEYLKVNENVSPSQVVGKVTATSNVNVRQEPNQNSEKIGIISGGETVDLLENQGEWCKVGYNSKVGFVKSEFVQIEE